MAAAPAWPPIATSARSSSCWRCRTTTRCACSATRSWRRSRTARAPTAASSCARWRRSSSATGSGSGPRSSSTAIAIPCAIAFAASRSSPAARSTRRETGSTSGSRCGAGSWRASDERSTVRVGVPTEIKTDEYRVALTPAGARELADHGHEVLVQRGAGDGSAIPDSAYEAQGARILPDADAVFGEADMIVKVKEPQPEEVARLEPRHTLFTYLHLAPDAELTRGLAESGATCVAYETVEDARGRLPLLGPMSEAGGKIAAPAGGGTASEHPGGRVHAREAARRSRDPARRRAGRGGRQGDDHRRRRGRHERGVHRARDGGDRLRLRPQHRPPARARHRVQRARRHVLRVDAGHRAAAARGRSGDRRRPGARREGAVRD